MSQRNLTSVSSRSSVFLVPSAAAHPAAALHTLTRCSDALMLALTCAAPAPACFSRHAPASLRTPARACAAQRGGDARAISSSGFRLPGLSSAGAVERTCAACAGSGLKPCGQCHGTGFNTEDLFGGRYLKGDKCWLCEARRCSCPLHAPALNEQRSLAGRGHNHVRMRRPDRHVLRRSVVLQNPLKQAMHPRAHDGRRAIAPPGKQRASRHLSR